jgi:hypothetical protein
MPHAKEMQSIVDYSRAPDATGTAAIDPVFRITQITNEAGEVDYPWFWTGTTHARFDGGGTGGVYICFGRATGYMNSTWMDVHGSGAQRSDQKGGDFTGYTYVSDGYYFAQAPQGDAIRIYNYVRLVRDADLTTCTADEDCDDGLYCTGIESCFDGTCQGGVDPCPGQACDEESDACNECVDDADCDDGDICTWDLCLEGTCWHEPNLYGDVDHNNVRNLFDIFCILDGIGGDFETCAFGDMDVHPCEGDGALNLFDIFAALGAIIGMDPCCSG